MLNSCSNENEKYQYAGFWVRFSAYAIDCVLIFFSLLVVRFLLFIVGLFLREGVLNGDFLFSYSLKDIVLYGCSVSYFVCSTYYTGTTIGKKLMHLKVISKKENKLSFLNLLYRETVGRFLSSFFINIGYMMIGIDKEKCGLHDILCDTRVIYDMEKKAKLPDTSIEIIPQEKVEIIPEEKIETNIKEQGKIEDETNSDDGNS